MLKVAIVITVPPGYEGNGGCLEECQKQVDAVASEGRYSFSIFLNYEGAEGYQAVWETASKDGNDLYLWVDQDLMLVENALASFLENSEFLRHKAIIAGTVARSDKSLLFGGRTRRGRLIEPDSTIPVPCQLFDMSLALIPNHAFSCLENASDMFHCSITSYGYGAKVAKAGVSRVVAPGVLARTSRKIDVPVWKDPDSTLKDKFLWIIHSLKNHIS